MNTSFTFAGSLFAICVVTRIGEAVALDELVSLHIVDNVGYLGLEELLVEFQLESHGIVHEEME